MEGIRLYEYDYDKPELSEETLEHHGILGMSWGRKNGPPYPLDSDKSTGKSLKKGFRARRKARKLQKRRVKSLKKARKVRERNREVQQEVKKTKEDILKSKDISSMAKNIDMFSNQEINDMITRLDTENRLKERVAQQSNANRSKVEKSVGFVRENVGRGLRKGAADTISTVSENALKIGVKALARELAGNDMRKQVLFAQLLKKEKKK